MLIKTKIKEDCNLNHFSKGARRHTKEWTQMSVAEHEYDMIKADKRLEVEDVKSDPVPTPTPTAMKKTIKKVYKRVEGK
jgi:hypothetical protein